jgi:hypothetical protein
MWHRVYPNIVVTSILILDDKVAGRVSGGAKPADHLGGLIVSIPEPDFHVCQLQDERNQAIAPDQEDSWRSRGSGDIAGENKSSNPARFNLGRAPNTRETGGVLCTYIYNIIQAGGLASLAPCCTRSLYFGIWEPTK